MTKEKKIKLPANTELNKLSRTAKVAK